MSQSRLGGLKAAETNRANNPDFYRKIGKLGGLAPKSKPTGFAAMPKHLHKAASSKGGRASKRGASRA